MKIQSASEFRRHNSRRLWIAVTFLVALLLVALGIASYLFATLLVSDDAPALIAGYRLATECAQKRLMPVAQAAERYYRDKGHYPERTEDVYPVYLEQREALLCPADPDKKREDTSFDYRRPGPEGATEAILLCDHHPHLRLWVRRRGEAKPGHTLWVVHTQPREKP